MDDEKVIIGVKQGIIYDISKPQGISIEVRDYDVEGISSEVELPSDENGKYILYIL